MAWSFNGRGKSLTSGVPKDLNPTDTVVVATETITLGAGKGNRYSSVIDFIPYGMPFTVISNTAQTNLSGSASDQLYAQYNRTGTFVQIKDTLRDCNYNHDAVQGTSFRSVDNTIRYRYIQPDYVGSYPYWKIRIFQAAVESSAKTVALAIIVGKNDAYRTWQEVQKANV